jgi:hypothetical protein
MPEVENVPDPIFLPATLTSEATLASGESSTVQMDTASGEQPNTNAQPSEFVEATLVGIPTS